MTVCMYACSVLVAAASVDSSCSNTQWPAEAAAAAAMHA